MGSAGQQSGETRRAPAAAPDARAGRPAAALRPEIELLLCCARTQPAPETTARIQFLLGQPLDWNSLRRSALGHGVLPLLYRSLSSLGRGRVPDTVLEGMQALHDAGAARSFSLVTELVRLVDLLEGAGIPVIPYKGPALAASLYGRLLLRHYGDLDLLVRPADVPRAAQILMTHGYSPKRPLSPAGEAALVQADCERSFLKDGDSLLVELHWGFCPRYCSFRVEIDRLWERQGAITVAGRGMRGLAPEDLLLVLCAHASWHLWERVQWIADVAELLRTYPALDAAAVVERRRAGGRRMLGLGLRLARDLLGARVPPALEPQGPDERVVAVLAAYVYGRLCRAAADPPGPWDKMAERRFLLTMREQWRDRWGYGLRLARDILPPSSADRAALSLPPPLIPLYALVRPLRLAGKYGRALIRRSGRRRPPDSSGG